MEKLREAIECYVPFNPQEEADKALFLGLIGSGMDLLHRENRLCHLTASGWILNRAHSRVLMAYHNIYQSWSWLGGHADGNPDLPEVALKEAREEAGITHVKLLSPEIYSLESLTVDGHEKHGRYVPSHLHLNVTYLLEADEGEELRACPGENSGVRWFTPREAVEASDEPWFRERIYCKLNAKLPLFL